MSETNGIYKAMAAVMAEMNAIGKDKMTDARAGSFHYRGIDDVYNAINPLLGKHQIFVLPSAQERTTETRVTKTGTSMEVVTVRMHYTFAHSDGSCVECTTIGEAMDSGDKATNKAMAIAHKYAILQTFCIPTEDMPDPDAEAHELAPRQKVQAQREAAKAANPEPMTAEQSKALMAYLTQKHGNNREGYLAELSQFFERKISSSRELTKTMVSQFLDFVMNPQEAY